VEEMLINNYYTPRPIACCLSWWTSPVTLLRSNGLKLVH